MAKTLESFTFTGRGTPNSAYEKYLDGRIWEIDCEKDHPACGSPMSVLASINTKARKAGKKVRSQGVRGSGKLIVQVYTPE